MYLPTLPTPGDTIGGGRLETAIGGKGANQAVASHLAGADTRFISCVGDDASAATILTAFGQLGLPTTSVTQLAHVRTGTACIFIDAAGENSIGITPGANAHLDTKFVASCSALIKSADVLLMQLEVPVASVVAAARLASQVGTPVVLNPAPAQTLPDELYPLIDIITPNRGELAALAGVNTDSPRGLEDACSVMLDKGVTAVVVTLGCAGVLLAQRAVQEVAFRSFEAFDVNAVDTTAAGDVFNGYFVAGLDLPSLDLQGTALDAVVQTAMAAAALAITREGAIPSIPNASAVADFLASVN